MNGRFRSKDGKGTALRAYAQRLRASAVGRALIAVMENYQNPDGSIDVPGGAAAIYGRDRAIEKAKCRVM